MKRDVYQFLNAKTAETLWIASSTREAAEAEAVRLGCEPRGNIVFTNRDLFIMHGREPTNLELADITVDLILD